MKDSIPEGITERIAEGVSAGIPGERILEGISGNTLSRIPGKITEEVFGGAYP